MKTLVTGLQRSEIANNFNDVLSRQVPASNRSTKMYLRTVGKERSVTTLEVILVVWRRVNSFSVEKWITGLSSSHFNKAGEWSEDWLVYANYAGRTFRRFPFLHSKNSNVLL